MDEAQKVELKEILQTFSEKHDFVFAEIEDGFVVLTKEEEKDFFRYNLMFGNIVTILFDETIKGIDVTLQSDGTDKRVIRELSAIYRCEDKSWDYDQLSAPKWQFSFILKSNDEVKQFLDDMGTISEKYLKEQYPENREKEPTFIFAFRKVAFYQREQKEFLEIAIMEKEDWIYFKEFMCEYYHNKRMKPIGEVMETFGVYSESDYGLKSENLNKEEVKQQLESHPKFEYSEEFQAFMDTR